MPVTSGPSGAHSGWVSTRTSTWTITAAPAAATVDDPDAWAAHGAAAVSHAVDLANFGHTDVAYSARHILSRLREQTYATRIWLVATPNGHTTADEVVGVASVIMPRTDNDHLAHVDVVVHPEHRRKGVGTALMDRAEELAREAGRTTVIAASEHPGEPPADEPDVLVPPTGSGRIRGSEPGVAFAARRGYVLEQGERYSVLELPVDPEDVARLHAEALRKAGDDYRLVRWADRTPDEWVDHLALLETRMSTDAPSAGLAIEEDRWDADRVRTYERQMAESGSGYLLVAAEHIPSGTLAAFTMVELPVDRPHVIEQGDTLVLKEHRGRRLGMLVKTAMLDDLAVARPEARRIHTWNAEENDYMLAINVALGFRRAGVVGVWQRTIA